MGFLDDLGEKIGDLGTSVTRTRYLGMDRGLGDAARTWEEKWTNGVVHTIIPGYLDGRVRVQSASRPSLQ